MLEKAYIRFREDLPDNQNTFAAADGFAIQGIKVVPFYGFGDLDGFKDIGEEAIVCGNIGDVQVALELIGKPVPKTIDYPKHLDWLLRRNVERTTVGNVRASVTPRFIKPVQQKLFTGFVWDPSDPRCRLSIATVEDDAECWVSDVVDIVSEWRCFVKRDELVGVRHYKGDWAVAPDKEDLNHAIKLGRGIMPAAHSIDLGITSDGATILIESNDGYALGAYGLASLVYARFIEERWLEMVR